MTPQRQSPDLYLPLTLLSRYLYFLGRRPLSASNAHFLARRIRGLHSLAAFFLDREDPAAGQAATLLLALTPANLFRQSVALQTLLKRRTAENLPRGIVVAPEPPDADFWRAAKRVILMFGPGIGIGDEIICFRIPAACKALAPDAKIEVLSSYAGLWDGARRYHTDRELIESIRAADPLHDVIFFVEFEPSGLTAAICHEPSAGRFVELSLGTRSVTAYDAARSEVFRMPAVEPCYSNYYFCLERMMQWLGAPRSSLLQPVRSAAAAGKSKELVVLASPFTSKEDPSEGYWSRLLARMIPPELPRPVRIAIDTGGTHASASFAAALARSARSHDHPDLRCETVRCEPGRNAPLDEMLQCIGEADVVVTADSFPAHAAAAFGRLAFVIGRQGVENWRAPSPTSFYLPAEAPVEQIASSIRQVLRATHLASGDALRRDPGDAPIFRQLCGVSDLLAEALDAAAPWPEIEQRWSKFATVYRDAISSIHAWPGECAALLTDRPYSELCASIPARASQAARTTLADEFSFWTNSNLCKYLRLARAAFRASL